MAAMTRATAAAPVNPLVLLRRVDCEPHLTCEQPVNDIELEQQRITAHLQLVSQLLAERPVELVDSELHSSPLLRQSRHEPFKRISIYHDEQQLLECQPPLRPLRLTVHQYAARCRALEALQQYIDCQEYPQPSAGDNDSCDIDRLPVFIDRVSGVHCAVAHMIAATDDGGTQLARRIDNVAHTMYIAQMQQALVFDHGNMYLQLVDWLSSTGLSWTELALIQPTYYNHDLGNIGPHPQLDAAAIQQIAALQQADGSFDVSDSGLQQLAEAMNLDAQTVTFVSQRARGSLPRAAAFDDIKWNILVYVFAELELRIGVLPGLMNDATAEVKRTRMGTVFGSYKHYQPVTSTDAERVLKSLYVYLEAAANQPAVQDNQTRSAKVTV